MRNFCLPLLLIHFTAVPCSHLYSQPSEERAPVVKLQKALQIDAKSNDWPWPASLKAASAEGRAAMRFGWDENCFYAFIEVQDGSPWVNNPSRPEEAIKGGDGVALYFQTRDENEQRLLVTPGGGGAQVLAFRSNSKVKRPYTFASPANEVTFDYVGPLDGVLASTLTTGAGYSLELALPWKSLGFAKPPELFRFDTQILFSDPAGTTNLGSAWWHAKDGPGSTIEDLPTEATLYPETWGKAVLVSQAPVSTGTPGPSGQSSTAKNFVKIDLPRSGKLSVVITSEDGWILRELVSAARFEKGTYEIPWDGRDRYGELLPLGNYHWKALLFDGMGAKFMGSVGNSGRPPYRTADQLGSLGGQHGSAKAIAADAGGIYMCGARQEGPPAMRKIEPATGKALWKRSAGSFQSISAVAALGELACIVNVGNKAQKFRCDLVRIDPKTGLDVKMGSEAARKPLKTPPGESAIGGLAIVGNRAFYSVPAENRIGSVDLTTGEEKPDLAITSPSGLARLNDHQLAVCSETKIVALEVDSARAQPLISGLDAPRAIAVAGDGSLFVSDLGKTQQIKYYSKDGKLLGSYGVPGGKPIWMARYNPLAFDNITGIAFGPDGNLWLAEDDETPNRFVKLSAAGSWLEDFYGPTAYNTFGPDLDDFNTVYYNSGGNARSPKLIETKLDYDKYRQNPERPADGWSIQAIYDLGLGQDGVSRNIPMTEVASTGYGHVIAFKADDGNKYLFRSSKSNRAKTPPGAGLWIWKTDRWLPCAFLSAEKGKPSWSDANGDGLIQEKETYSMSPIQRFAWIRRDFTLEGFEGKATPSGRTEQGIPNYQTSTYSPYLKDSEKALLGKDWTFGSREENQAVYYVANIGPHRHLTFWDRATENRLIKVKDGSVQWMVGQHLPNPTDTEFATASGIAGIVGDIVLAQNVEPSNYPAFTTDGFALGNVLVDENGYRPRLGPGNINIENFTGLFVEDPKTGKPVLFTVSSGDDRILEITGPGVMTRLQGSVHLNHPTVGPNTVAIPYSTWYGNTGREIGVDGELTEWNPEISAAPILDQNQVVGDIRLRRDAGALHLIATVLETSPILKNGGVRLSFTKDNRGENPLSICLAAPPNSTGSAKLQATLVRNGKETNLDKIKVVSVPRWRGLGYRMEAEIPLDLLPEYSGPREQTFRREVKNPGAKKPSLKSRTEVRADLVGPLSLKLEVQQVKSGQVQWSNGAWMPVELAQSSVAAK